MRIHLLIVRRKEMEAITEQHYRELLTKAELKAADPSGRIGKQLTYSVPVPRMVVLHLAERDAEAYVLDAVLRVLELSGEWLLPTSALSTSRFRPLRSHSALRSIHSLVITSALDQ